MTKPDIKQVREGGQAELFPIVCQKCRNKVWATKGQPPARFCIYCGASLEKSLEILSDTRLSELVSLANLVSKQLHHESDELFRALACQMVPLLVAEVRHYRDTNPVVVPPKSAHTSQDSELHERP